MQTATEIPSEPKTTTLRLLLVEDDDGDAEIVQRNLRRAALDDCVKTTRCTRLEHALERLEREAFDVILLDLGLPDGVGLGNLERVAARATVPVVILTGRDDEATAMRAVRSGAQDYLVKGHFDHLVLARALRYAVERHRLVIELRQAAARESELKDRLLSHVSHELRTPLTAIHQFVGILRDGLAGPLQPKQLDYLAIVGRNVEQLRRMIADLMEVSRLGSGKLPLDIGLVDVTACAAEAVESLAGAAAAKGIELSTNLERQAPRVLADHARITQVLENLIGNAIKFTADGGHVRVGARSNPDQTVTLTVEDDGCGIAEEALGRIFDRLYQVQPMTDTGRHGLGLGLHISHEIVSLLGGRMSVRSEAGKGSCFAVVLPVYRLRSLVERVLGNSPGTYVTLLSVCLRDRSGATASIPEAAFREVVRAVQSCVLEATDAVLPERAGNDRHEHLFAIARANSGGGAAIAERIRAHLSERGRIESLGCSTEVAWQTFDPEPGESRNDSIERMTRRIRVEMQAKGEQP
ncbi:MAG: hybrid sensor histidine kinase/response regulator [Planctomycetota bacterium]